MRDRLTPDQKAVWDITRPHVPEPSGDQTPRQAVNLAVLSFLYWCDFDGLGRPTEEAIRAEFEGAGASELAPDEDWWADLRREPGRPSILAPRGTDAWRRKGRSD